MPQPPGNGPQDQEDATRRIEQLRADLAELVAQLIERLPDDAGIIERVVAEGGGTDDLRKLLNSLPDTDDLTNLAALLNNPDELRHLLAEREANADAALNQSPAPASPHHSDET